MLLLSRCARMRSLNGCREHWNGKIMVGRGLKSGGQGRRLENQDETRLAFRITRMTGCWFIWRRRIIAGESTEGERWNSSDQSQRRGRNERTGRQPDPTWKSSYKLGRKIVWCCGSYGWKSMNKKEDNMVLRFLWLEVYEQENSVMLKYLWLEAHEQYWVCK